MKFVIIEYRSGRDTFIVEAENKEAAIKLVEDGTVSPEPGESSNHYVIESVTEIGK